MANSLSACRYSCFALFTLCNAVICCVSVWNLLLAQQIGLTPQVDAYLIAISAFGILYIFPVMFLDLLRKNNIVGRVWFEALWIGLFWVLELAGAVAATTMLPSMMCNFAAALLIPGSCITSKVLIIATWINVVVLLAYFCLLMISSIIHMKDDSQIWRASTRTYPWYKVHEPLQSAQSSPVRTTWSKAPLPATTPQIRLTSEFGDRMVSGGPMRSSSLRSSTLKSAAMKSAALRSSQYDEKQGPMLSAVVAQTPMTASRSANKSAKILQSAWLSATVTPASPPSDEYGSSSSGSSDLTSTPTGLPPSATYVPFSSTIKPSPVPHKPSPVPLRSSSLSATFNLTGSGPSTPAKKGGLRGMLMSPKPPTAPTAGPREKKSKRKSTRPPPLDMTRLHSTYHR